VSAVVYIYRVCGRGVLRPYNIIIMQGGGSCLVLILIALTATIASAERAIGTDDKVNCCD
jgi:hypothetical protein